MTDASAIIARARQLKAERQGGDGAAPEASSERTEHPAIARARKVKYQSLPEFSGDHIPVTPQGEEPSGREFLGGLTRNLATTAALMATMDEDAQADIIRAQIPEAKVIDTQEGKIVEVGGRQFALNHEGLSGRDAANFTAELLAFVPAARLAGIGKTILQRIGLGSTGAAATAAGLDQVAEAAGSEQGLDLARMGFAAAGAGVGEAVAPVLGAGLRKVGEATGLSAGVRRVGEALGRGVGTDDPSVGAAERAIAQRVAARAGQARHADVVGELDAAGIADANAAVPPDPNTFRTASGFQTTRGQATRNADDLAREQELRNSIGPGGQVIRQFDEAQGQQIAAQREAVQSELAGGRPVIGSERDMPAVVQDGVQGRANALRRAIDEAYDSARDAGSAYFRGDAFGDFLSSQRRAIQRKDLDIDAELTPRLARTLQDMEGLAKQLAKLSEDGVASAVSLRNVERWRRKLNNRINDAPRGTQDFKGLMTLKGNLDEWVDDAIDNALHSGSKEALDALKNARGLRAEFGRKFQRQAKGDDAGSIIEKFVEGGRTDQEIINWLIGAGQLGARANSARVIQRVRDIVGTGSQEWQALREAAWLRLSKSIADGGEIKPGTFRTAIRRALQENGQEVMETLFTPEERRRMLQLAADVELTLPPKQQGFSNQSGSGFQVGNQVMRTLSTIGNQLGLAADLSGAGGVASSATGRVARFVAARGEKRAAKRATQRVLLDNDTGEVVVPAAAAAAGATGAAGSRERR